MGVEACVRRRGPSCRAARVACGVARRRVAAKGTSATRPRPRRRWHKSVGPLVPCQQPAFIARWPARGVCRAAQRERSPTQRSRFAPMVAPPALGGPRRVSRRPSQRVSPRGRVVRQVPHRGLWLYYWGCVVADPSPALRLASLTTRPQLRVRVVKDRDPERGMKGQGDGVVAVGDQSDWVTKNGGPERWRRWRWIGGKQGGVGGTWVGCLVCGAPADFACARRPTPQTPRGAMLDSDMPSDVLACCL